MVVVLESQEHSALSVRVQEAFTGEALLRQLVDAVLEPELGQHNQALALSSQLKLVASLVFNHSVALEVAAFDLALIGLIVLEEKLDRQGEGNLALGKQVDCVELVRGAALLAHGQYLEPAEALDVVDDFGDVHPLHVADGILNRDFEALELAHFGVLLLLVSNFKFVGCALELLTVGQSLAQGVVSVHDKVTVVLVVASRLNQ